MHPRFAASALAVAVAVGGCGGSSGPGRAHYIAQANQICAQARTQAAPLIQQLAATVSSPTAASERRAAPSVEKLEAIGQSYLAQLRALKEPSADHAAIERFLTPSGQVIDAIGQAASALKSGDTVTALAALQQIQTVAEDANGAARAYGLEQCGSVLTTGG